MSSSDHFSKQTSVLVTGGCGAIGSCVVNYLTHAYPDTLFVNLDALTYAANKDNIKTPPNNNYVLAHGDICDVDFVKATINKYQPSIVIHLAAETHVDLSFGNSFQFTKTNIMGTHTLLECFREHTGLKLFVHMSTDEVYGSVDDDSPACCESSMFAPSNPYSATKAGAEMLCHAYNKSFKLPIIIVRCNNAISPFQHPEKLIPQCVQRILNNQKINIHGDGSAKRTFIHATDIARALDVIVAQHVDNFTESKIYNIGSNMEYDVLTVVKEVLRQLRPGENWLDWVNYVPDRAFQDYRYHIDSSALRAIGWKEEIGFEDAIADVIRHSILH